MHGLRLLGFFAVIPATVLFTISFFVLFTARKIENGALKVFGVIIAASLWAAAALVISAGAYAAVGAHNMKCPMMSGMAMGGHWERTEGDCSMSPIIDEKSPGQAKDAGMPGHTMKH